MLVVGCIHGDECAGLAVVHRLRSARAQLGLAGPIALVPNLNPDGAWRATRLNGRGVDLNRNFAAGWRLIGRRWDLQYSGPRPFSEPETRLARDLIARLRPQVTVWFHQQRTALVRAWGQSVPAARRYACLAALPFRRLRWPAGTAPHWQNRRFAGSASFVVELARGRLSPRWAQRHARAIIRLAGGHNATSRPAPDQRVVRCSPRS